MKRNRHVQSPGRKRRALTLIDLVAIVGMGALLLATLLPSLDHVRGRSQLDKCLGNLKQIGRAMAMYFNEHGEWFPFEKRNTVVGTQMYLHAFYYGGHPGRQDPANPPEWWGYVQPVWRNTPGGRPFNQYIYPGLPKWDVPLGHPMYEKVRDVPVFLCPADNGHIWSTSAGEPTVDRPPGYRLTGSSYDCNYHFAMGWARYKSGTAGDKLWMNRSNAFLRVQLRRAAARFIVVYEDPFDSAQYMRLPRYGWHGELNRHSFLFLDSHAANMLADTTKGASGPGWKSASGYPYTPQWPSKDIWWLNPEHPDFRYRDIEPLP